MQTIKNLVPQGIKNYYHALSSILAVIYNRYPAKDLTVIGVTGTDGKTTTSTIIYHILNQTGHKAALLSTVSAYIGDETINTGFHTTTPNEWTLQKLLKTIKDKNIQYVVLESTSIGLDQHRLIGTNIDYAVVTNFTHEHLDYHKTLTNYAKAKAKLVNHAKVSVINADNDSYSQLKPHLSNDSKPIFYSIKKTPHKTAIKKIFPSTHNQQNALAAITIVEKLGITPEKSLTALKNFPGVPGRLEYVKNNRDLDIVVDFAHTPNALESVLTHLKKHTKGRLVAIFGATGRRDPEKRPMMGKIASELADEVVLTSDDNYDEDVNTIIRQIKEGITTNHGHIHAQPDRFKALDFALNTLAKKGDTIAVLGQGHEQTINLDGKTETPWNDTDTIKKLLTKKT